MGKYNLPIWTIPKILKNKLMFMSWEKSFSPPGKYGRILSIAVSSDATGQGIGKNLVQHGIDHLRARGARFVKLEVRPDNQPALRAYNRQDFRVIGKTRDIQGEWLVMVKEL